MKGGDYVIGISTFTQLDHSQLVTGPDALTSYWLIQPPCLYRTPAKFVHPGNQPFVLGYRVPATFYSIPVTNPSLLFTERAKQISIFLGNQPLS